MKPIYQPKGRAREYGDYAINIYSGCNHGCSYCYASAVLRKDKEAFAEVQPRAGVVEAVKRQLERENITGKLIHLCFTCDPYPADIDTTPTREIIQAIKDSGNNVQILTKGGFRAERDFDLLGPGDWFGVTLTGEDGKEPRAAVSSERYATIKAAHARSIQTWVSFEPVYNPEMVYTCIRSSDAIDLFKIGKLNHADAPRAVIEAGGWAKFGAEAERLCREYGRNYYVKEDLRAEMEGHK
ncbi:MAG: hypothetical protein VB053_02335 [Oscillibacter ruminantium]|uniref:radical SAM protein n=1 Tax=Oscillibacter ruminantium TaxID=1263547 RepID=UPI002B209D5C|nr:radical SAM protein [Oscillibacter ruminantium]MEA5041357.1 hypothetical protein [Oscillibacter ruminantium]